MDLDNIVNSTQGKKINRRDFLKEVTYLTASLSALPLIGCETFSKRTVSNVDESQGVLKYPGEKGFLNSNNLKRLLWEKYDPKNPEHNPSNPNVDGKTMLKEICGDNVYYIDNVLNKQNVGQELDKITSLNSKGVSMTMFYDPREISSVRTVLGAAHLAEEKNIKLFAYDMFIFRDPLNKDGYSDDFELKNYFLTLLIEDKKYWNKEFYNLVHKENYIKGHAKRKLFPTMIFSVDGTPVEALALGADLGNHEIGICSGIYNAVAEDLQKNIGDLTKRQYHFKGKNIGKAYEGSGKLRRATSQYLKTQK